MAESVEFQIGPGGLRIGSEDTKSIVECLPEDLKMPYVFGILPVQDYVDHLKPSKLELFLAFSPIPFVGHRKAKKTAVHAVAKDYLAGHLWAISKGNIEKRTKSIRLIALTSLPLAYVIVNYIVDKLC